MPGLDKNILDMIDHTKVIDRIKIDIRTDFILAPHYNAIFINAGGKLWERVNEFLSSGKYQPDLPLTISVPKERGFTRPGSILGPVDRFVYQALIDIASPELEAQLDRGRTFSHVPSNDGKSMFEPAHNSWDMFQNRLAELCKLDGYIVKADIANYFERIPQHHLVNLMRAAKCPSEVVNLLEEILLAFQERDSSGIIQGVFPSDILGNFFLSEFDAYCDHREVPSARYVDDMYMHFSSEVDAKMGFIDLIERLRKDGLHLNEYKSGIKTADEVLREETEVDVLFEKARREVREELAEYSTSGYGFTAEWEWEEPEDDQEIELAATEMLYSAIEKYPAQADKIERFCLPLLRAAGSNHAVEAVLDNLLKKPYLTSYYDAYLSRFVGTNKDVVSSLELVVGGPELVTDYQRMYLLGALFGAEAVKSTTVKAALQWLENTRMAEETRAVAALFAAKHGNPSQKRAVRLTYENEPSMYVRSAILYASRYFTTAEKKTCKKAWGAHSLVNTLIAHAI